MTVYDTIKAICDEKNISIMELEQRANVGNGVIGHWRHATPRILTLEKVAAALNMPVINLLDTIIKNKKETSCRA